MMSEYCWHEQGAVLPVVARFKAAVLKLSEG
jgi:hypothetical protein